MNLRLISAATIATLALAGCASTSPSYSGSPNSYPPATSTTCYDCGTVTRIDAVGGTGQTSGATGAVLGGVVGAAAGRALTNDESKGKQNTATVAGAVAGAVAGNAIQKNMQNKNTNYVVYVRLDNGNNVSVNQADIGGIREGSYVRVYNGQVWVR